VKGRSVPSLSWQMIVCHTEGEEKRLDTQKRLSVSVSVSVCLCVSVCVSVCVCVCVAHRLAVGQRCEHRLVQGRLEIVGVDAQQLDLLPTPCAKPTNQPQMRSFLCLS
jgi:hypothetical protein